MYMYKFIVFTFLRNKLTRQPYIITCAKSSKLQGIASTMYIPILYQETIKDIRVRFINRVGVNIQ